MPPPPPTAHLTLREEDVVRLALEFLHNRDLHIAQLALERETGVINGNFSDDVLFLRQLILDGQWDDVLEFIQPLEALPEFDSSRFSYIVLKHKYVELLCIKSEAAQVSNVDSAVDEVVRVLSDLEKYAPTKDEYSNLCLLLTLPRLTDHLEYRDWNPSNARVRCFREVYPLVEKFLSSSKGAVNGIDKLGGQQEAKNDRLIQLIIKGVLYESCVNYCQAKATGTTAKDVSSNPSSTTTTTTNSASTITQEMSFSRLLDGSLGFSDSDLSLLSWLQSIPGDTFAVPFEQRTLNVDVERLERPALDASWTEHMLVVPIKPRAFPHSAMPFTRPRSAADAMTRSLMPGLDGLGSGLNPNPENPDMKHGNSVAGGPMSRSSFASFHLTGVKNGKLMSSSVDRLFENTGDAEVFLSSSYADFHNPMPAIHENVSKSRSPDLSQASTPEHHNHRTHSSGGRETPPSTNNSTARSSRRDSLNDSNRTYAVPHQHHLQQQQQTDRIDNSLPQIEKQQEYHAVVQNSEKVYASPHQAQHNTQHQSLDRMGGGNQEDSRRNESPVYSRTVTSSPVIGGNNKIRPMHSPTNNARVLSDSPLSSLNRHRNPNQPFIPQNNVANITYANSLNMNVGTNMNQHQANGDSSGRTGELLREYHHKQKLRSNDNSGIVGSGAMINNQQQQQMMSKQYMQAGDGMARSPHPPSKQNIYDKPIPQPQSQQHQHREHSPSGGISPGSNQQSAPTNGSGGSVVGTGANRPRFVAVTTLEDAQAVRCAEFHPNGRLYAVGSNSKTLRICAYPQLNDVREQHTTYQPTVLFKRTKHHKGSIYCLAWSPAGDLMATGSNDKTVKLMRFNADTENLEGQEVELTMHDGTVRDLCFIEDSTNKSSLLISGGAGDCKIYVTDCETGTPFQALSGHTGHILSLYNWGGALFASGSQDRTVRFWDLRTRGCVNTVTPGAGPSARGSPVAGLCVDPSGRLLVSGHEDSSCVLYDIRGDRPVQCFKPHASDIRSIRFSPSAYYLLTGGYDNKLVLTDLQGDLTMPLPSVVVAQHNDKVISGRWHPTEFSFLSTSADKTATLWALPPL